jgi:hypothetical protein
MQSVCYLTTHNVSSSSFTNSVCLPVSMRSPASARCHNNSSRPSRSLRMERQLSFSCQVCEERLELLDGAHRDCYRLSWSSESGQVRGVCWVLYLVRLLLFLPFLDVSTECADNFVGFVAYALSNRPRRITRRIRTRESRRRIFLLWSLLPMPLIRRVRKLILVDVLFPYFSSLQLILAPSPIERSPYRHCKATFKWASYDLDVYIILVPHRTRRDPRPDVDSSWPLPSFTNLNLSFVHPFSHCDIYFGHPQTLKTSALAMQHRYTPCLTYLCPCTSSTSPLQGLVVIPCLGNWAA